MSGLKTCPDLHRLADSMGVRLRRHTGGPKGLYHHATRTISTRRGMSIQQYRSTLAHELGHAHYGDIPVKGIYSVRQEIRADSYAARTLITPQAFFDAAAWHNGHLGGIADELEVTHHLLLRWIADNGRKP